MTTDVRLRGVLDEDLFVFFDQQLDAEANRMAAFTAEDPTDRANFDAHWKKIRATDANLLRTILWRETVAGWIASFDREGMREVSYWIGRDHWGKGVATGALAALLEEDRTRPIHARVARDNVASRRVLEKCGFALTGTEKGYANARGEEIEEYVMTRKAP